MINYSNCVILKIHICYKLYKFYLFMRYLSYLSFYFIAFHYILVEIITDMNFMENEDSISIPTVVSYYWFVTHIRSTKSTLLFRTC